MSLRNTQQQPSRSADPRAAGAAFAAAFAARPRAFAAAYLQRFGPALAPDLACRLSTAYARAGEDRPLYTAHVLPTAERIIDLIWQTLLDAPCRPDDGPVLILLGAAGCGRTTLIERVTQELGAATLLVRKQTPAVDLRTLELLERVLDSGRRVHVIYLHRPAHLAARGVVEKSVATGFTLPLVQVAKEHRIGPGAFLRLHRSLGRDPRVVFAVIDNSGRAAEITPARLTLIRKLVDGREHVGAGRLVEEAFLEEVKGREGGRRAVSDQSYQAFTGTTREHAKSEPYETGRREPTAELDRTVHDYKFKNEPDPGHAAFPAYDITDREEQIEEHVESFGR